MKAVFLDFATLGDERDDAAPLLEVLPQLQLYDATPASLTPQRTAGAEVVLTNKTRLDAAVLQSARPLRYIGIAATGTDNVDLDAACDKGIAVTNIRAYCTNSVVEHVIAVLLGLTRSLGPYRDAVRAGRWQESNMFCLLDYPLRELSGLTIGIIGYGELGRAVAAMAGNLGMHVLIARRRDAAADDADGRCDFDEVLRKADVLSLHCPLTPATRHLIGRAQLARMKMDAVLINTARGGLVDSQALADALRDGRIGGAAIDVLAEEPPRVGEGTAGSDPLLTCDSERLLLTPHIAWASREARRNAVREVAMNVQAFREGRRRNRLD